MPSPVRIRRACWRCFPSVQTSTRSCRRPEGLSFTRRRGRSRTPLHDASLWNFSDVARILLEAGAEVNCADESGKTPLHLAAMGQGDDSAACLKLLLAAGADPNARDAEGNTPLHEAAGVSSSEGWVNRDAVRVLEEAGADSTLKNKDGKTPQELIGQQAP